MKRVLVLDANQRSALATTRSLGRRGVVVFTADESLSALAGCSRYSAQYLVYPSPRTEPKAFITRILQFIDSHQVEMILPMTELTTELLLQAQQRISNVALPFPSLSAIEALANKCALLRLAQSLNVPIPETWFVDTLSGLPKNLDRLPYPLVLKPGKSWVQLDGVWERAAVQIADTPNIASGLINSSPVFQSHPFLLQRRVTGTGEGVFALYDHGTPIAFFSHRRLREKPPWGGVSVLSESTPVNPTLLAHAQALLNSVAWHGIAMVEFKVSGDGTPYLMEINTRLWGSLQLAIDAGVDFPWLLYKLACGQPVTPVTRYKTGRRLRWLLGDVDGLYLSLRDPYTPFMTKLVKLGQFLWPTPLRTRHEINRWSDLGPFWWELRHYLRDLMR